MKKHFKTYRKYYTIYGIFLVCLFGSAEIYSHWHFEVINPAELYLIDKKEYDSRTGGEIPFMSIQEWQQDQDNRQKGLVNEITHQICESFDPWYERNDNPVENTERGRD